MAGRFTNLKYDKEAYGEELARSTDPLLYRLDPNFAINCQKCFAPYGPRGGQQDAIVIDDQINIDSTLRGINKINTRSNCKQIPDSLDKYKLSKLNDCCDNLETEYTRFTYPAFDIRGLTTRDLHLSYPLFDPQCQIYEPSAVNTRLQAKDNHRAIWQVPASQRDLYPTERLGQPKACQRHNCNYASFTA